MGKYRKQLKAEKAKVKLRVKNEKTKFLPKGQNVTNTTFKVKPLQIVEQLKEKNKTDLLSHRGHNIKELLAKLKHHNSAVKTECCKDLRLLIEHFGEVVDKNLSMLLLGLAPLVLDHEKGVRQEAIKCLSVVVNVTDTEKIEPFFEILSKHLKCAMTNINFSIQEDALLYFDALITHVPTLIAKSCNKILPSLFALISKLNRDATLGRTLTINLQSKLTTSKWRIQVLARLGKFLEVILDDFEANTIFKREVNYEFLESAKKSEVIDAFYNYNKTIYTFVNINRSTGSIFNESEADAMIDNIAVILELLYDIWMEVAPTKNDKFSDSTNIKPEAANILTCTLKIMKSLHGYFQHRCEQDNIDFKLFFNKEFFKILDSLLDFFPYSCSGARTKETINLHKILNCSVDENFTNENLTICEFYCISLKHNRKLSNPAKVQQVVKYIQDGLNNRNQFQEKHSEILLLLINTFLKSNFSSNEFNLESLVLTFLNFIKVSGQNFKNYNETVKVLIEVGKHPEISRINNYQQWIITLPNLLTRTQISIKILEQLLLLSQQQCSLFIQNLRLKIKEILSNFNRIQIINSNNGSFEKRKIIEMFYHIRSILSKSDKEYIMEFSKTCDDKYQPLLKLF